MKQPTLLRFVPPEKPILRFSLRALMLLVSSVGPFVLLITALPKLRGVLQHVATAALFVVGTHDPRFIVGGVILVVALVTVPAWCASFVRPTPLAICFFGMALISAVLGISLIVAPSYLFEPVCALTGLGVWAAITSGFALGLSWTRYA